MFYLKMTKKQKKGFSGGSVVKNLPANAEDANSLPGWGRSPGEGNGNFPSGFLSVYAQQWDCWIIRQFYFQFFKESPHYSP